jgi:hypothetical protein
VCVSVCHMHVYLRLFKCVIAHVTISISTIVFGSFTCRYVEFWVLLIHLECFCCINLTAHPISSAPSPLFVSLTPSLSLHLPLKVGLLPVPHPIIIRKYQPNRYTCLWFTAFQWGVIFMHNQTVPLFDGKKVKLFMVQTVH